MSSQTPHTISLPALILPDVHQKCARVEEIIASHGSDCASVVFLGDYLDSRESSDPTDLHLALRWLAQSVRDPRRVHLLGNHDVAYFFPAEETYCSGWSEDRQRVFDEAISTQNMNAVRERLGLAVQAGPWVLSHAGFPAHFCRDATPAQLIQWAEAARAVLTSSVGRDNMHPLLGCGVVRRGRSRVGGLTWLDWDHEFTPIPGVHQIVGHTSDRLARGRHLRGSGSLLAGTAYEAKMQSLHRDEFRSVNWCLDTGLQSWAIAYPDRLEIHTAKSVTIWPAPVALNGARTYPELKEHELYPVAGERPPLFVPWEEIDRALTSPEMRDEFQARMEHHRSDERGPSPEAVASALRHLQRRRGRA